MRLLATFANPGEAALVQSLLADAGILADLQDGSLDLGGIATARLRVAEEDLPRASEILARHRASPASANAQDEHPNARFPFLGIMGATALIWCGLWLVYVVLNMSRAELMKDGVFRAMMGVVAIVGGSLLWGLAIGFGVAILCLIVNVTWRKLKNS